MWWELCFFLQIILEKVYFFANTDMLSGRIFERLLLKNMGLFFRFKQFYCNSKLLC